MVLSQNDVLSSYIMDLYFPDKFSSLYMVYLHLHDKFSSSNAIFILRIETLKRAFSFVQLFKAVVIFKRKVGILGNKGRFFFFSVVDR